MPETTAITGSGPVPGYLAQPEGEGPWPGVVVIHELFGLNDDIRAVADRFASMGYLAFAPDLLGRGNKLACIVSLVRSMLAGGGSTSRVLLECREWLAADPGCTGRVGVAGFCMGGGFALLVADKGFDVASVAYGALPRNLEKALAGSCPMVASYGGLDQSLKGAAARLEAGLEAAGVRHDVREYPEAGHSFINNSSGPAWLAPLASRLHAGHVDTAAEDAWTRIDAMFDQTLRQ